MASIKPVEEASQDFTAELASLRDDVAKLNSSLSEFTRTHSDATTNTIFDVVDNAQQKISDTAKPMVAALIAMVAGMLVGLLSRGRK